VAQLLCPDIHEQILALWVVAVQALDRILHGRSEFPVRPAELLEQHISETGVRYPDPDRVHQLFYVVIHAGMTSTSHAVRTRWPGAKIAEPTLGTNMRY